MQVFVIQLFDVSIMLNLPFVNLFLNHTLGYTMQKKRMRFIKMHCVYNLIVTEKSMTSITFLDAFEAWYVCVLLNTFYGSVLTLIGFAILTENTLCVFKILSIHLAILKHATDKYILFIRLWSRPVLLSSFFWTLFWSFQYYILVLEVAYDIPKTYLMAIQYRLYLTVFEELQGSNSIVRIANHFYSTMSFWFVLCSYGFAKN